MAESEILDEIKRHSIPERLAIIEDSLRSIRQDLQQHAQLPLAANERDRQLRAAAEALLPDYSSGNELTAFTALDAEDFHA